MTLVEGSGQSNDMDVDALINEVNAPAPERPMSAPQEAVPEPQPQAAAAPQPEPPKPTIQEFEFEYSGKKIKEPLEMILKRAGMGYDYAQKMEAFKRKQEELETKYKPYDRYKEIDEYVKKDPQWWEHVEQSWQERLSSQDPNVIRLKSILDEELKPVKELLTQKEQEAQQAKLQEQDSRLDADIKSIREKYSDLDFDARDEHGKSLEDKVLEHGAQHNFPSFKAAFLDFYHDQLEKRWEARGREAVSKDAQKRAKLGLSGTPQTPKRQAEGYDVRGKGWNEVLQEVLERENIT